MGSSKIKSLIILLLLLNTYSFALTYEEFQKVAYGVVEGARANGTYGYDSGDDDKKERRHNRV